jgi:hypothetical protein
MFFISAFRMKIADEPTASRENLYGGGDIYRCSLNKSDWCCPLSSGQRTRNLLILSILSDLLFSILSSCLNTGHAKVDQELIKRPMFLFNPLR